MLPINQLREDIALLKRYQEEEGLRHKHEKVKEVVLQALERVSKTLSMHCPEIDDRSLLSDAQEAVSYFSRQVRFTSVHKPTNRDLTTRALSSVRSQIAQRKIVLARTSFEARTGRELTRQDFSSAIQPSYDLSIPARSAEEREKRISDRIVKMKEERALAIANVNIIYEHLFPEGKFAYPQERVCDKYFPYTFAWYIGALQIQEDGLLERMIEIGIRHNITVVTDAVGSSFLHSNVSINPCTVPLTAAFPQDYMDFAQNAVQVPVSAALDQPRSEREPVLQNFFEEICKSRVERSKLWEMASEEKKGETLGLPYQNPSIRKAVFLAEATKTSVSMNLSYSEGGNVLLGEDRNGPYAIIGLDSLEATRHLMSFPFSVDEAKKAFAIDYGIPVDRLYFIEQPGDFHLDMSMAIVGERTVLLNDAKAAYASFSKERREHVERKIQEIEDKKTEALKASSRAEVTLPLDSLQN